jgi:hypothetical protein
LVKQYNLTPSALDCWISQSSKNGSFKTKDNRTPEENELIALRKELKQLRMENDILKQAALIMARKLILRANQHRYAVAALCFCLGISKHYAYYQCQTTKRKLVAHYVDKILTICKYSYQSYGGKRIRFALQPAGISVFRRYIARVMKSLSLISKYTIKRYRGHQTASNSAVTANHLQRQFDVGTK